MAQQDQRTSDELPSHAADFPSRCEPVTRENGNETDVAGPRCATAQELLDQAPSRSTQPIPYRPREHQTPAQPTCRTHNRYAGRPHPMPSARHCPPAGIRPSCPTPRQQPGRCRQQNRTPRDVAELRKSRCRFRLQIHPTANLSRNPIFLYDCTPGGFADPLRDAQSGAIRRRPPESTTACTAPQIPSTHSSVRRSR